MREGAIMDGQMEALVVALVWGKVDGGIFFQSDIEDP
jgi:hypothetical protein